jgi:hypothetical protein
MCTALPKKVAIYSPHQIKPGQKEGTISPRSVSHRAGQHRRVVLHTPIHGRFLNGPLATALLVVGSALMLSWVALLNQFPLVFPDTLSYATTAYLGEIPGMFSAFYSFFILPLHRGEALWPVVFMQGALLGHFLYIVIRCVSNAEAGKVETLFVVAALALFSSLPWFTGQIMPDVFSSIVLLGIFLLAFCTNQLTRTELIYVVAITTAATATHISHVPIAFGLILLCSVLRPLLMTTRIRIRRWVTILFLPITLATCSMLAVNLINSGSIAFARNSNVFLLAKLIEEGPALAYLTESCPAAQYSLCPYLDEMRGMPQDVLKWWGGSPFYKVAELDQLEPEARNIVMGTLRNYPIDILKIALRNSGTLLTRFGIGEGLSPDTARLVAPYLGEVFGVEVEKSLLGSRQAHGGLPIREFRQLHFLALLFSACLVVWLLVVSRRRMHASLVALYILVVGGILLNVVVTSALSGPFDRYLARISWLIPFVALVGMLSTMPRPLRMVRVLVQSCSSQSGAGKDTCS